MVEPHTLRIEADSLTRIARVHEALRDLGLELCSQCHIWKGPDHMTWLGADFEAPTPSFTRATCTTCNPSPPAGEGDSPAASGVRGDAAARLRQAIAQVAQPGDHPSAWAR